jgi:RNA polymerase sigma factor, sigma-70 family
MGNDMKHFEELIKPIYNRLYRYIYCIVRNKAMADDAMQNALVNAYTHFKELKDKDKFENWAFTIGKRESINIIRSYQRETSVDLIEHDDEFEDDQQYFIDDIILNNEVKEVLIKQINSLSPEDRDIVILRYYSGLKLLEIAEVLNTNYNTIRTRHKAIKKKIYNNLKKSGFI